MLMVTLTVEEAQSRLGLSAANLQRLADRGDLQVEYTDAGDQVTEATMADFRQGQRERKLRRMEQITALSDEMGPTEWRNCGRGLAGWTDHNRVDAGLTRRGALLEEGAAASVEAANIRPSGFGSIGGWTLDLAAADGGCLILQT